MKVLGLDDTPMAFRGGLQFSSYETLQLASGVVPATPEIVFVPRWGSDRPFAEDQIHWTADAAFDIGDDEARQNGVTLDRRNARVILGYMKDTLSSDKRTSTANAVSLMLANARFADELSGILTPIPEYASIYRIAEQNVRDINRILHIPAVLLPVVTKLAFNKNKEANSSRPHNLIYDD